MMAEFLFWCLVAGWGIVELGAMVAEALDYRDWNNGGAARVLHEVADDEALWAADFDAHAQPLFGAPVHDVADAQIVAVQREWHSLEGPGLAAVAHQRELATAGAVPTVVLHCAGRARVADARQFELRPCGCCPAAVQAAIWDPAAAHCHENPCRHQR